ncbi:MAG: PDZ domain-containing protein [Betaproteobacteria bacterium]|nr:PDZ domain-containing protein [Betaproteobacteria bacterium]
MADDREWAFPKELRPRQAEVAFDLEAALDAVVTVRSEVPDDAFTASILGTERAGNGVVIADDGLILTIGYLITEAETLWLSTNDGQVVVGHPLAFDFATGFGLVQPLGRLELPAMPIGSSANCSVGDQVFVIGHGGAEHALKAEIFAKREFAGYWEYVLDEALFVTPAHPQWGGAALVDHEGRLVGIGSLLLEESVDGRKVQGNMFVPTDLFGPIRDDLLHLGRVSRPTRPWLGMYTTEAEGQLIVAGMAPGGPAERAGMRVGDLVLEVGGERVTTLADLFRKVWATGPAGTEIPLAFARDGSLRHARIRSADRADFLKKPRLH